MQTLCIVLYSVLLAVSAYIYPPSMIIILRVHLPEPKSFNRQTRPWYYISLMHEVELSVLMNKPRLSVTIK